MRWVCVLFLSTAGCGLNVQNHYARFRPQMVAHDYDGAAAYLDSVRESFYSKDNRLLYYMDQGMVLHLGKKYSASNAMLEKAKVAAEELWTESISKNAAAWVTTDNSLPYQGEDFEKVLVHFIAGLNAIGMGSYNDARVEARQITNDLQLFNSKYAAVKNAYRDDAFARWLAGRLAETDADDSAALNDAWIDYRTALTVYEEDYLKRYGTPPPNVVIANALRCAQALGADFSGEFNALRKRFPSVPFRTVAETRGMGRIVFIHMSGEAPFKIDRYWTAQAGPDILRIAYPQFVVKPHLITYARLTATPLTTPAPSALPASATATPSNPSEAAVPSVPPPLIGSATQRPGKSFTAVPAVAASASAASAVPAAPAAPYTLVTETELAEDISAIAVQNLSDHMARIQTKAIARAVSKYLAGKVAETAGVQAKSDAGNAVALAGALWNIGNAVAEESDKRSWITLPSAVTVGELFVPPGAVTVDADFMGPGGYAYEHAAFDVKVKANETVFLTYRTYR